MESKAEQILGYILTREKKNISGQTIYIYSGIGECGLFKIEVKGKYPLFFVNRDSQIPKDLPIKERKNVKLTSFSGINVDALYFNLNSELYTTKNRLKELSIKCYESDINPEERYLMERFIYGSLNITGKGVKKEGITIFRNPELSPSNYKPDFRILSMDIETGRDGSIYSIGLHLTSKKTEYKAVLIRDSKKIGGTTNEYITFYQTERELLTNFIKLFKEQDPDIIIGWHVIGFDLEFIQRRCDHFKIYLGLGRDGHNINIKRNPTGTWGCTMNGRVVIDGPPTLRGAFYSFESYKLENVAQEVLGTGKDISGEGKVDEIERRFAKDKISLAHYNLLDCTLVTDIFNKLGLIDLTFIRAITCGLTMDRIGMSVAAFDYFMLPMTHRKGFVAPDVDGIDFTGQGSGGLVFTEEPGFYNSIVVLDFKSLYPSIIRTFFIDPISRVLSSKNPISTPANILFSSTEHVLPKYIKELMDKREEAKKNGDKHLSQAIKILMNSFYGVMGTQGSRFYHQDLPKGITETGQWLLTTTKEYLKKLGYEVIYGDTDSLFVELKENDILDYDKAGENLAAMVNSYLSTYLKKEFNVDSVLELEYEKHFRRFFLPGLRGSNKGAKKRYAGLCSTKNGEELTFTGLEFVRSDWTELAKEFQYNLFSKIFSDQGVESYIKTVVRDLENKELDHKLIYKKRLKKTAREYTKNIPPQVKAALKLDPSGKLKGNIKYVITNDGPTPAEFNPENINYNHYIDKQLKPIADSILPFVNNDFDSIVFTKQPELF